MTSMLLNWSGKGRGSEAAVWEQPFRAEAAAHRGHLTATVMIDLVKAFESAPLWRVRGARKMVVKVAA